MEGIDITQIVFGSVSTLGVLAINFFVNQKRNNIIYFTHLKNLNDGVYRPLLNHFRYYYFPIIQMKISNVIAKDKPVYLPTAINCQYHMEGRIELVIATIQDILDETSMNTKKLNLNIDNVLFEDAKENHDKTLFLEMKEFNRRFEEYNETCLAYVRFYKAQIETRTDLPLWLHPTSHYGVNAVWLAAYIWQRQLGLKCPHLHVRTYYEHSVILSDNQIIARGNDHEIQASYHLVREMIDDKSAIYQSKKLSKGLRLLEYAFYLEKLLDEKLHTHKLKGKCPYT